MKKAQIVIEYAILSAMAIIIIAMLVVVFNLKTFHSGTTFGFRVNNGTVVVPPMTP